MSPSLAIVKSKDGIIRDVYGRPVIVVFDSKQRSPRRDRLVADPLKGALLDDTQSLEFVNMTGPATENVTTRILIRTHVIADYERRRTQHKATISRNHKTLALLHVALPRF